MSKILAIVAFSLIVDTASAQLVSVRPHRNIKGTYIGDRYYFDRQTKPSITTWATGRKPRATTPQFNYRLPTVTQFNHRLPTVNQFNYRLPAVTQFNYRLPGKK